MREVIESERESTFFASDMYVRHGKCYTISQYSYDQSSALLKEKWRVWVGERFVCNCLTPASWVSYYGMPCDSSISTLLTRHNDVFMVFMDIIFWRLVDRERSISV